jgi:hypothetical protein
MVATMLGNCFLSAAAVYLIADVGENGSRWADPANSCCGERREERG